MLSAKLGIRTVGKIDKQYMSAFLLILRVDIGNPQLSMHSIRETGGVDDVKHGTDLLKVHFYSCHEENNFLTVMM